MLYRYHCSVGLSFFPAAQFFANFTHGSVSHQFFQEQHFAPPFLLVPSDRASFLPATQFCTNFQGSSSQHSCQQLDFCTSVLQSHSSFDNDTILHKFPIAQSHTIFANNCILHNFTILYNTHSLISITPLFPTSPISCTKLSHANMKIKNQTNTATGHSLSLLFLRQNVAVVFFQLVKVLLLKKKKINTFH